VPSEKTRITFCQVCDDNGVIDTDNGCHVNDPRLEVYEETCHACPCCFECGSALWTMQGGGREPGMVVLGDSEDGFCSVECLLAHIGDPCGGDIGQMFDDTMEARRSGVRGDLGAWTAGLHLLAAGLAKAIEQEVEAHA
jgi:hypothetical protein